MRLKKIALLVCATMLGASGMCFDRGLDFVRQALLPSEATPGTCFELAIGDTLIEIPCSVLD